MMTLSQVKQYERMGNYEELQDEQWYHQNATSRMICVSAIEASISLSRSISLALHNWSRIYV